MTQKPQADSTGLVRSYQVVDGDLLHPTLQGTQVSLMPKWVRGISGAPANLALASLAQDLMQALQIPEETYKPAQKFVRDYGQNVANEWGQSVLIAGGLDPVVRRILAAGVMNEIVRVYHFRADISLVWLIPRNFESLHVGYDANKQASLFSAYTSAKLAVLDSLTTSMRHHGPAVEEVLSLRLSKSLPSVLVMNESPVFSPDLASELSANHHLRCVFPT